MIVDENQRFAVSYLGWVDRGSVWRYDRTNGRVENIRLSDAKYLRVTKSGPDEFVAVHDFEGSYVDVTTQTFASPEIPTRHVRISVVDSDFTDGLEPWPDQIFHSISRLSGEPEDRKTYLISVGGEQATTTWLEWFDEGGYDLVYQGVVSVIEVPESGEFVYGVQRSSDLVLIAPGEAPRDIALADRGGNPDPVRSSLGPNVWVVDYDTVVRLDRRDWSVAATNRVQSETGGMRMFAGNLWLPSDESFLLVPRPGSGDVIALDPTSLEVTHVANVDRQPLTAAAFWDGQVIARDWHTGDLLVGSLGVITA